MAGTVDDFARRAATLPAALVHATPAAVHASAAVFEDAARAGVAAATGGDSKLSGVKSGSVITLDAEVRGAGASAQGVVVPRGPIMLIEEDVRAHGEPFQYKASRRVMKRGRKRLSFGGRVYSSVKHPGTQGKHPVRRAFEAHHPEAARAGLEFFASAARDHLGGRA